MAQRAIKFFNENMPGLKDTATLRHSLARKRDGPRINPVKEMLKLKERRVMKEQAAKGKAANTSTRPDEGRGSHHAASTPPPPKDLERAEPIPKSPARPEKPVLKGKNNNLKPAEPADKQQEHHSGSDSESEGEVGGGEYYYGPREDEDESDVDDDQPPLKRPKHTHANDVQDGRRSSKGSSAETVLNKGTSHESYGYSDDDQANPKKLKRTRKTNDENEPDGRAVRRNAKASSSKHPIDDELSDDDEPLDAFPPKPPKIQRTSSSALAPVGNTPQKRSRKKKSVEPSGRQLRSATGSFASVRDA